MVMHLTQCCCGCSLKTGSVIIGVLFAAFSVGILIPCIIYADILGQAAEKTSDISFVVPDYGGFEEYDSHALPGYFEDEQYEEESLFPLKMILSQSTTNMDGSNDNGIFRPWFKVGQGFFIAYAVISAIQLIFSIMLIFGASAEKPKLIKPWITAETINAILSGITNIIQIVLVFMAGGVVPGLIILIFSAILMCIWVYFILVVNSLHTELSTFYYYWEL